MDEAAWRLIPQHVAGDLFPLLLDLAPFRYQLASCSDCLDVTLWGPGGPRHVLRGHSGRVIGMRFFPLGDRLLTWGEGGEAFVWCTSTGEAVLKLRAGGVEQAGVFPGGDRVFTCTGGEACSVWDAATGERLSMMATGAEFAFTRVDMSASGRHLLAWGGNSEVEVWSVAGSVKSCFLRSHRLGISDVAVFPDGERVVTGSFDRTARIWKVSGCEALHELPHDGWVSQVAVLSDGALVATMSSSGLVSVWLVETGELLQAIEAPSRGVQQLVAYPRGDRLAVHGATTIHIYSAASGELLRPLDGHPERIHEVVVSPGGDIVVACGAGRLTVWDEETGERLATLSEVHAGPPPGTGWCTASIGLAGALDSRGFGRGFRWRDVM